jgi:hypothetical protein
VVDVDVVEAVTGFVVVTVGNVVGLVVFVVVVVDLKNLDPKVDDSGFVDSLGLPIYIIFF